MSNKTLYFLIGLVVFGILLLFSVNLLSHLNISLPGSGAVNTSTNSQQLKINKAQVKAIAVEKEGKIYNLNMKQQTDALSFLDRAEPVDKKDYPEKDPNIGFNRIIIYRYNLPDIVLIPIAYERRNLVFETPILGNQSYMMEFSGGEFTNLIQKATEQ